jgi:hypothetical protein
MNTFLILLISVFVFLSGRDLWRMTPIGRYLSEKLNSRQESVQPAATTNSTTPSATTPAAPER